MSKQIKMTDTSRFIVLSAAVIVLVIALIVVASDTNAASKEVRAYNKYVKKLYRSVKVPHINGYTTNNIRYDKATHSTYWKAKWKSSKKKIKLSQYKYYRIMNINKDKSPELILSNSRNPVGDGHVLICKYAKGKVRPVFSVYGLRVGLFKKKNKIAFWFGGSSMSFIVMAKVKGAKLKRGAAYADTRVKTYGPYHNIYHKGKKVISKSKYNRAKKNLKRIKFKKATPDGIWRDGK